MQHAQIENARTEVPARSGQAPDGHSHRSLKAVAVYFTMTMLVLDGPNDSTSW